MTTPDELKKQIDGLRDHFDERMNSTLRWAVGICVTILLAVVAWEVDQSSRISTNEAHTARNTEDFRDQQAALRRLTEGQAQSNREISTMIQQILAQGQTLSRIENTLDRLVNNNSGGQKP